MLRSITPFLLASFGFTLIALAIIMPLFEWQISEIVTDLPPEVHINPSWTTKFGDSLESGSYNARDGSYVFHQVLFPNNGNRCSPEQLTSVVQGSRRDEMLERIALNVNQRITRWLTGLTFTGQSTMAVILLLCGMYIWWFTIWYNRPFSEAIISTVVAVILLAFLINVWMILVPETGVFVCRPELRGTVTFNARLSKVHYETLLILFMGIGAGVGAFGTMLRQVIRAVIERKESAKSAVG